MARTVEQIKAELDKISEQTRTAYDTLNGTAGRGGLDRDYKIAVRDNNQDLIKKYKPLWEKAQADYKKFQEKKNDLTKELKAAETAAKTEKESAAKAKSVTSVYDKTLNALKEAELGISGYKGTEKYVAAYQAAQQAFNDATKAGVTVPALPAQLAPVPPVVTKEQQQQQDKQNQPEVLDFDVYKANLAKPENKEILKGIQQDLIKNWGYKGKADGSYSLAFQNFLEDISLKRDQLPQNLQGGNFTDFIKNYNKSVITGTSGTGGSGTQYTPTTNIYSKNEAASVIQNVYNSLLGRDATAKEINDAYAQINAAQKDPKNAVRQALNKAGVLETTGGVNATQLVEDIIRGGAEYKGSKQSAIDAAKNTLRKTAIANGLDIDTNFGTAADEWAKRIANGEDASVFTNLIRQTAKTGMPENVAKLLDQGVDLETIYAPYKTTMQTILEVPSNTISLTDPALKNALTGEKPMTLFDFQSSLRKDPRWQYTKNAHDTVTSAVQNVLKDFGFVG